MPDTLGDQAAAQVCTGRSKSSGRCRARPSTSTGSRLLEVARRSQAGRSQSSTGGSGATQLGTLLASAPVLTRFEIAADI